MVEYLQVPLPEILFPKLNVDKTGKHLLDHHSYQPLIQLEIEKYRRLQVFVHIENIQPVWDFSGNDSVNTIVLNPLVLLAFL